MMWAIIITSGASVFWLCMWIVGLFLIKKRDGYLISEDYFFTFFLWWLVMPRLIYKYYENRGNFEQKKREIKQEYELKQLRRQYEELEKIESSL